MIGNPNKIYDAVVTALTTAQLGVECYSDPQPLINKLPCALIYESNSTSSAKMHTLGISQVGRTSEFTAEVFVEKKSGGIYKARTITEVINGVMTANNYIIISQLAVPNKDISTARMISKYRKAIYTDDL